MKSTKFEIKNTLGMFDLLKGIIMIFVMLFHTYGLYDYVNQHMSEFNPVILAFLAILALFNESLMPALFIVSGYGFRKTTFKKSIKKQFDSLIIPYIISAVIMLILHFVLVYGLYRSGHYSLTRTMQLLAGLLLGYSHDVTIMGHEISATGPIWFLLTIFISKLIFNELLRKFEGRKLFIITFAISCLGWGLSYIPFMPWCISRGLVATLFICLGYLAKKNKLFTDTKLNLKTIVIIIFIAASKLLTMIPGETNLANDDYACGPLSILFSGLIGLICIYLCLQLNRFGGSISSLFRKTGRYSLYVLCIHAIEIMAIGRYLQWDFVNSWDGSIFVRSIIIFGVRVVVVLSATAIFVYLKAHISNKNPFISS